MPLILNAFYLAVLAMLLSACASTTLPATPRAHLKDTDVPAAAVGTIPPLVALPLTPPAPVAAVPAETFSVVVNNVRLHDLLFALARDARVNVDIHPGITGSITLNAIEQTLPQLLQRITRQTDTRFEFDGATIMVMPDTPELRNYRLDYVNMSREMNSNMAVSTQVASVATGGTGAAPSPGGGGGGGGSNGNNSITRIENRAQNKLWDTMVQNVRDILRETDKILPEGSSEEVEEVSGQISTTGTHAAPGARTKRSASANNPEAALAASPAPAELQNRGTRITRRTTYREAASVIANPETGVLSVRATSRQHEKIQAFLDQVMRSARRQVMIEATVVEVELDTRYRQGIDWSRLRADGSGLSMSQIAPLASNVPNVFRLGYAAGADSRVGNLRGAIQLLENFGTAKVLSSPKISVLNNQSAVLKVVDNEVYFTMTANTTANQSTTTTTFTTTLNSVPVGFVMNVTPQLGENDQVVLNVRPSISRKIREVQDPNPDLARAQVVSRVPVIRTREMESVIRVDNGNIVVMGGLMEDETNRQTDTLPGLDTNSPLGRLLANRDESNRKTELVIFIRPVIIRDAGLQGDYQSFRDALPTHEFFNSTPKAAP